MEEYLNVTQIVSASILIGFFVFTLFTDLYFMLVKPEQVASLVVQVGYEKSDISKEEFESLAARHLKINDLFWMRREDRGECELGEHHLVIRPMKVRLELKSGRSVKFKIEYDLRRQVYQTRLLKGLMDKDKNFPIKWTTGKI